MNPVLLLRMIEDYSQAFRFHRKISGYDVAELLKEYAILFIPVVNPDGYEIARLGFGAIANPIYRKMSREKKISHQNWKYNARGVDINRNFPCKSYVQQQLWEYPGSESETQMLMRVIQDYETAAYLDFHSRGKIIYYYRGAMPHTYNQRCRPVCQKNSGSLRLCAGTREEELLSKVSGGNSVHFYSENTGQSCHHHRNAPARSILSNRRGFSGGGVQRGASHSAGPAVGTFCLKLFGLIGIIISC